MTTSHPNEINLIAREDDHTSRRGPAELVSKAVDVGLLQERFRVFMAGLQSIMQALEVKGSPFELAEITFTAEISADGDFKLLGAGVGIEANGGVTFVLKRREKVTSEGE